MSIPVKARDLVRSKLPDLRIGDHKTKSDSTHALEFQGMLGYWANFELEVRKSTLSQQWSADDLAHQTTAQQPSRYYLSREHYMCGDEYSVQGRFGQNIGHVMSAVFGSLGFDVRLGDFKSCSPDVKIDGKVPDFVLATKSGKLLATGEGKTPWVHFLDDDILVETDLRHALGQVARYMITAELIFGFLTTYQQTIFLKLEKDPKSGAMVLWHSNVINGNSIYAEADRSDNTPRAYHNKVTLRECFLFIAKQVVLSSRYSGNYSHYVQKRRKSRNAGHGGKNFGYISDIESIQPPAVQKRPPVPEIGQSQYGGHSSNTPSPNRSQAREQSRVQTRSQVSATSLQPPSAEMSLRSRPRSPQFVPRTRDGFTPVFYDDESDSHYFVTDTGAKVKIKLLQNKDGGLVFDYHGSRYRAKLDKGTRRQR
ncbi:hypothetical protein FQN54_002077 [Arachnomyces sp. PD_36]|nr:hypothetical protein FQN54_002077 [Arachnomyces sp. PD_36]